MTVTYTYLLPCPTVSSIGRIGVHHQQTRLVVTFDGAVNPITAANPANYFVITPSGRKIPIKSADFNPATNSVTLVPAVRLNVHYHFNLSVLLPCPDTQMNETVVVRFGGKGSLIGFHNHHGAFVVVKNGRIVGYYNRSGVFVPVHKGKIEKVQYGSPRDRVAKEVKRV